ncbi:MAG TPA: tetratricopeptide repeat protein, partial [Tepidisphaeraceae bacterium]|nr:tetratricopeptide repeat protein [Tepidisphaeraceae bacterium]
MSDEAHLIQVDHCDDPNRIADVVFIHGLDGHPQTTWTHLPKLPRRRFWLFGKRKPIDSSDGFWPNWLAEDFPNVGIWSLGYPAAASAWMGHAMALPPRAENVLELFRLDGLGKKPMILIVHSLGGLLAKTLLQIAETHGHQDWAKVGRSIRGILFLATPHAGSFLASIGNIFQIVARANDTTHDLQLHSSGLEELNLWFRGNFQRLGLKGHVLRENERVKGVMVVDPTSADPGIQEIKIIKADANHITICKPPSRGSIIYKTAVDFVRKCIEVPPPPVPPPIVIEPPIIQPPPVSPRDVSKRPAGKPIHLPYASLGTLFKGRDDFLTQLDKSLKQTPAGHAAAIVGKAIHGLGGVGKTRLAVEYAWRHVAEYSALLFVPAETPEAMNRNLAGLCAVLDLPEQKATDDAVRMKAVLDWLENQPGWLLILDNLDTREATIAAEKMLDKLHGGQVLFTGRFTQFNRRVESLPLDVLEPDNAVQFLLDRTPHRRKTPDEAVQVRAIVQDLGNLALALEQAGAYIDLHRLTFAQYQEQWKNNHDKVLGWFDEHLMDYPASIAMTWQTSVDRLSESARNLLNRLAWLAPEPIPESLLDTPVEGTQLDQQRDALADLASYSLVTRDRETPTFTIHRLVQDVTRQNLKDDDENKAMKQALNWLDDAYVGSAVDVRNWPTLEPLTSHARAVAECAESVQIADPTARLLNQIAILLNTKALHREAEPLMARVVVILEKNFGVDHPNVARALNNLAQLLQATNRLEEAEPLMRRALSIDETSYGQEHPDVARDLNNLAQLLQATNRLEEAEPLMRRALSIDEASYGLEHPEVAIDLNNLASLLQDTNRLGEAEPLMRRALSIDEKSYGPKHPKVAIRLNNLATLLQATNRLREAEPLMRRALSIDETSYGPEHPDVARDLNNLAQLLQATNRLEEAEPLMRRALSI